MDVFSMSKEVTIKMKKLRPVVFAAALLCVLGLIRVSKAEVYSADIPKLDTPAIITSLGQSPDAYCVSVLAKRAKLPLKYEKLLKAKDLGEYKTLFMVVGASLKGFGSAGVNLDTEIARGKEIIRNAKEKHIYVVIAHTGGVGRRESMSNKLLDMVGKEADFLLIYKEGNKDDYFTKLAKEKKIPMKTVDKVIDIQGVLVKMFGPE